jgi:hypothetical protein
MPYITEGLDAAEQAADAARKSSFHRIETVRIKDDGKPVFLRFISEQTITFGMHSGVDTKKQPAEFKGDKWPPAMFAVCQNDVAFRLRGDDGKTLDEYEEDYGECYIHTAMKGKKDPTYGHDKSAARVQTFGLAVLRKPRLNPVSGAIDGFEDITEEFKDEDGTVHRIPKVVIVQQTYSNFWAPLKASMFMGSPALTDKDFGFTRKENDYLPSPGAVTPDLKPGTPAWKRYEDTLALLGFDLEKHLLELSSPDWYARWFIPGQTPKGGYGRQGGGETEESADAGTQAGGEDPDQAEVEDFAARLQAARSKPAETPATA